MVGARSPGDKGCRSETSYLLISTIFVNKKHILRILSLTTTTTTKGSFAVIDTNDEDGLEDLNEAKEQFSC